MKLNTQINLIACQVDTTAEQLLDCQQKERYSFPLASAVVSLKCVSSAVCICADVIKPGACLGFFIGGEDQSGSCIEEMESCAECLKVTRMLNILYQTCEEGK